MLSAPIPAQAGLFSSLLGDPVYAQNDGQQLGLFGSGLGDNSQTMALLQANVMSVAKVSSNTDETSSIDENEDISIISDNSLLPQVTPLDALNAGFDESFDQVSNYKVRAGDNISAIAKMFGVSVNTIYWANDLKKGAALKEGQDLVILPFDGLTHTIKAKETLSGIASLYKADVSDILAFNGLTTADKLSVGDELIIPDGQKNEDGGKPVSNSSSAVASASSLKSVSGYFIYPLPKGSRIRKTQGIHDRYAIDIGAPSGTPIYASASGTVVVARNGYNGGYGNLVIVKHPNGTETRYAHMSKLGTTYGKKVAQGEVIGYVGTTGRSTGNHLHFEVRGAKMPF